LHTQAQGQDIVGGGIAAGTAEVLQIGRDFELAVEAIAVIEFNHLLTARGGITVVRQ